MWGAMLFTFIKNDKIDTWVLFLYYWGSSLQIQVRLASN